MGLLGPTVDTVLSWGSALDGPCSEDTGDWGRDTDTLEVTLSEEEHGGVPGM